MKVTQEKLPASQIGLEIEITPEMTKQAYEQVIQKFTRQANIPGFRRGKVPRQVIVQRFGTTSLKAAALEDLIDDSLQAALKQENIEALGNFQLRSAFEDLISQYEPGSPLTFSASIDVSPEVTLDQYQGLQVQAEEVKYNPEQVDKVLEGYREQVATLVPVEGRSAQMKDVAVVDFKGVLVGDDPDAEPEEFAGNEAQDFQVELGEGRFVEGFVDGIVGMNPGETKDVLAHFPADYSQENLAGRTARFTVTLKELKERELPELDDDFAQEVSNEEFETLAALRESLEKRYTDEAEQKTRNNQEEAILNELLNHITVDLPESMIEREVNFMLNQTAMQLQNQGFDIKRLFNQESIGVLKEQSRPEAVKRIKRTLALGEIAKKESIDVPEADVDAKVADILKDLQDSNIDRDRLKEVVAEDLLKEKIITWLIEHSAVELVPEGTLKQEEEAVEAAELAEAAEAEVSPAPEPAASTATVEVEATPVETTDAPPAEAAATEPEAAAESPAEAESEAPPAKAKKAKKSSKSEKPEE